MPYKTNKFSLLNGNISNIIIKIYKNFRKLDGFLTQAPKPFGSKLIISFNSADIFSKGRCRV